MTSRLDKLADFIRHEGKSAKRVRISGTVREVVPGYYRVKGLTNYVGLGDSIGFTSKGRTRVGEAIRIDESGVIVKPYDGAIDARVGTKAYVVGDFSLRPDTSWLGRVINAIAEPLDGGPALKQGDVAWCTNAAPPSAMTRARIDQPLATGIRAIDIMTPLCVGQRIGIFAGSGVGKSTLLSMLARAKGFDVIVVALVGERGREVREFLEGPIHDSLHKAVMVVSTGDESPMMRRQAPKTAMTVAEYFRDQGKSVVIFMDSVTRYAHAARDVALAAGEPAVARGFPPSVFSDLPRLMERAGPGASGSGTITGIYAVLIDGDDHNDPVADNIRGTLDGHIVLDRAIADQGRFPAINVLGSISRLADMSWTSQQKTLVTRLKALIARYEDSRDVRMMGGYTPGHDADLDLAIDLVPKVYDALIQSPGNPLSQDAFSDLTAFLQKSK